ncbi:hypothetical protein J1M35_14780 [Ottowia testudinis]|uniref:Uncharacterized protein n=1 Tax=Ottowia testudinis TaxID=2816950 RepID=A0A975CPQ3_9BURK|nr:hypothetical protein J1M35_14780 [Ottowia testudinis]
MIPKSTLVKVRLSLKPGGFDAPEQGWTGGWATQSDQTGSVYLNAEFVVLAGPYAKRKLWSLIGLYSPKGDEWSQMGRSFIRATLNSARGLDPRDSSDAARQGRCIASFGDLDGLEFAARVDVEQDSRGDDRNTIRQAIEPGHKDYAALMAGSAPAATAAAHAALRGAATATAPTHAHPPTAAPAWSRPATHTPAPPATPAAARSPAGMGKPAWAQ